MFNSIGVPGIILLVILALLLFGPNKLPELGRAVGRTFKEFKEGARDIMDDQPATRKTEQVAQPVITHQESESKRLPE
ncbi:MAG TPA: twin-arginine translocase TatA/TatE family subunit [Paenibacillus sp.]|jgi:sec-independent protein translocase protein TatA